MTRATRWGAVLAGIQSLFASALAFAQNQAADLTVTTQKTTTSTVWYTEWWAWAAGVAVFLIVIVALTTRGSSTPAR